MGGNDKNGNRLQMMEGVKLIYDNAHEARANVHQHSNIDERDSYASNSVVDFTPTTASVMKKEKDTKKQRSEDLPLELEEDSDFDDATTAGVDGDADDDRPGDGTRKKAIQDRINCVMEGYLLLEPRCCRECCSALLCCSLCYLYNNTQLRELVLEDVAVRCAVVVGAIRADECPTLEQLSATQIPELSYDSDDGDNDYFDDDDDGGGGGGCVTRHRFGSAAAARGLHCSCGEVSRRATLAP